MPSATHVQRTLVRYPLPNLRTVARALACDFCNLRSQAKARGTIKPDCSARFSLRFLQFTVAS
jgi:hypothetical protein